MVRKNTNAWAARHQPVSTNGKLHQAGKPGRHETRIRRWHTDSDPFNSPQLELRAECSREGLNSGIMHSEFSPPRKLHRAPSLSESPCGAACAPVSKKPGSFPKATRAHETKEQLRRRPQTPG